MPLTDWSVQVVSVVPFKNTAINPLSGQAIDPDGLTMSQVSLTLTHLPTGKVLTRTDRFSAPTREAIQHYARPHIDVMEANMAAQGNEQTPSPLVGPLDLSIPQPPDPRTQAEKDLDAFSQADTALSAKLALVEKLKDASPEDAAALDAEVAKLKAARDALAKKAIDAVTAVTVETVIVAIL